MKQVYKHNKVTRTFQCQAWVEVTNSFKVEEVLKKLIKHFHKNTDFWGGGEPTTVDQGSQRMFAGKEVLDIV